MNLISLKGMETQQQIKLSSLTWKGSDRQERIKPVFHPDPIVRSPTPEAGLL
jgi:hypothetical protein